MKTVILALFVLLVVGQSEALRCNCGGMKQCSRPVETCYGSNNVCASVIIFAGSMPRHFRGCMSSQNCMKLTLMGLSVATCCSSDQCN
uniref:UPAR/Ly6 domain-containing protein n=1 Tax=Mola mola TaxID=94237 RepID=A0A3Q3WL69_MOLML